MLIPGTHSQEYIASRQKIPGTLYTLPLSHRAIAQLGIMMSNRFSDKGDQPAYGGGSAGKASSAARGVVGPSERRMNLGVISSVLAFPSSSNLLAI